jgi:DNA-directed RNA polymerase subunit RPC12/RpoP
MSSKRIKGKETRKTKHAVSTKAAVAKTGIAVARGSAPVKTILKSPAKTAIKVAVKPETKTATRPNLKEAAKLALKEAIKPAPKPERIHSHPTMCLHCHLIVEMFHERGADPVKGAWQCPRCGHKYLFSHWKIKRQARGKTEAA